MSCRSSFSFMITAWRARATGVRIRDGPDNGDDSRDRVLRVAVGRHDDGVLVGLGRLESVELGAEQLLGKEVPAPGGQPPVHHLAVYGQEDQQRFWAPAEQHVTVGPLER